MVENTDDGYVVRTKIRDIAEPFFKPFKESPAFVTIQGVENGYRVTIGSEKFVFETLDHMLSAFEIYYVEPDKFRKKYMKRR